MITNKKSFIIAVFALISMISFSQEKIFSTNEVNQDTVFRQYILVNSAKPSKKIKLKDVSSYTLTYMEKGTDSIIANKIFYVNGNIRKFDGENIAFDIRNESIEYTFKDGSEMITSADYSTFYFSKNQAPRLIPMNNIVYLDYSSPVRNTIHAVGVGTMYVSAAIALVVGPALAVSYTKKVEGQTKKMNFNQNDNFGFSKNTYFNSVKLGVVGAIIGYPIARFSRLKRFNLTADKTKKDRHFWYLEEQIQN